MIRYLLLFAAFLCLTSCPPPSTLPDPPLDLPDPPPSIGDAHFDYWVHSPLHPGNGQAVQFKLQAIDERLISRVELAIFEYELYTNSQGLPSKKRKAGGLWGTVDAWEPATPRTIVEHSFSWPDGFSRHSNVEYIFSVINLDGAVTRRMALFDAGDSPWPQDKILLYATSRETMGNTINLCFFPDMDYDQNWTHFLSDVEALVYQGYHQNNKIRSSKEYWSFYYTRQETNGLALAMDPFNPDRYPPFMKDSLILGIDAFGLLHRNPYSDGAYLNSNIQFLAQNVFTAEGYNWGTAVHETGHAIFRLSDEYNGCACFSGTGGTNIFRSREACAAFNDSLDRAADDCTEIIAYDGTPWYLSEKPPLFATEEDCRNYNIQHNLPPDSCRLFQDLTGIRAFQAFKGNCIMRDDGDTQVPNFRHACATVIDRYYQRLRPLPTEPVELVLAESRENFFGYEPVAVLELQLGAEGMQVAMKKICYGIPSKNLAANDDFCLSWPGTKGALHQWNVDRPDCVHIHHGENLAAVEITEGAASCSIVVPLMEGLETITCTDNRPESSREEYRLQIEEEMMERMKQFKQD